MSRQYYGPWPCNQPGVHAVDCDCKWAVEQTAEIPAELKDGWRAAYKRLKAAAGRAAANRLLLRHAKNKLTCRLCGEIAIPAVSIKDMEDGRFHVAANCAGCGSWIKWLGYSDGGEA